ncbi:MAG: amidophosphoribosyltransferase [Bacteroidales bacterium]|nr:amidophosphoribosyltransferase [Bacteroidales bacterium]
MSQIHEECGVFGVFGVEGAAGIVRTGLTFLQHRGQEGCGIAWCGPDGEIVLKRDLGLVSGVFPEDGYACGDGLHAIGHVRYGTSGGGGIDNVQPFLFRSRRGDYATAHNGNIVNARELADALSERGVLFHCSSDSEVLGALLGDALPSGGRISVKLLSHCLNLIDGAFAFLVLTRDALYACRDKYGLRPLSIGRLGRGYVVGSETCALYAAGASSVRDVRPGEVVRISADGLESSFYSSCTRCAMCAMEYIYFARPDSDIEGVNVHAFRKESGKILFRESPCRADIVVGVPDSGLSAAIGYSEASGIPLEMALVKNAYIARTFIQPTQEMRVSGVRMKLSPVKSLIRGRRLVVIDDSIVRGTTSRQLIHMLRDAGASEIHVRIPSPPLKNPCYYGVDISSREELISAGMDVDGVCRFIGADSLAFISEEGLMEAGGRTDMCMACFNRRYPTDIYSHGT